MTNSVLPVSQAQHAIRKLDASLEHKFIAVVMILNAYISLRPTLRGQAASRCTPAEYVEALARQFVSARAPRLPQPPQTVPDEVVGTILNGYYSVPEGELGRIAQTHSLSMAAENLVGDLLERYIAEQLEPMGWIWCSGSVVRSVDFIRPASPEKPLVLLQIKNRDNSENSSSSAIRDGTNIQKWFRSFSRKPSHNWGAFPDEAARCELSESGFKSYVRVRMTALRSKT